MSYLNCALRGLCLLAALCSALPAMAESASPSLTLLDAGGRFRTEYARQIHNDNDKMALTIEPEIKLGWNENSQWFFKPRLAFSPLGDYRRIYDDQFERSNWSRIHRFNDYSEAEVRELYFKTRLADGNLTIGKQQIAWGAADGLRVLDVINPVNLVHFVMAEPVDSRIPLWTVNYQRAFDFADVQLLWIPDNTYNDYSAERDWYYLTSPKIVPGPAPAGVTVRQNPVNRPGGDPIRNADYGVRLTKVVGGMDLSFNYLYHYDDDLVVQSRFANEANGPVIDVNPTYKRSHLIGGTFSAASGNFVYRGEFGFNTARYVLSRNPHAPDGVERRHDFNYVLGIDWSGIRDTFISVQFFQSILSGRTGYLVRDKVDSTITLNVSRNFANETWRIEGLLLHNLNDHDSALRARIKHSPSDKVSLYLQYENYAGNINGIFGQFRDKGRVLFYVDRYF